MRQILILSGKGGTGKTTIASAFVELSHAKYIADCDVEAPNLQLVMRLEGKESRKDYHGLQKAVIDQDICINCGLCKANCRFGAIIENGKFVVDTLACEGCAVCERICPVGAIKMVDHVGGEIILIEGESVFSHADLAIGNGNSGLLVTEVKKQLDNYDAEDDIAIIDGSPGIGCPVIASVKGVDFILNVAEPSISGLHDLKRVLEVAKHFQVPGAICVNKYDLNVPLTNRIKEFARTNSIPFVGQVPFDMEVGALLDSGSSILRAKQTTAQAVKMIFENTMIEFAKALI
ncbi:MAG: 4Fe-4S binding protein [Bacilli bacterium]|nr:4Fe-4S binding protein [Bacilli bacterium]